MLTDGSAPTYHSRREAADTEAQIGKTTSGRGHHVYLRLSQLSRSKGGSPAFLGLVT